MGSSLYFLTAFQNEIRDPQENLLYLKLKKKHYTIFDNIDLIFKVISIKSKPNLYYTRCNMPMRVSNWRDLSVGHCFWATQLLSKKCRRDGELLATMCAI